MDVNVETDDLRSTIEAAFEPPAETPVVETPEPEAPEPGEAATPETPEVAEPKADHPTDPKRYADGTFKTTKSEAAPEKVEAPKETPSTDTAKASTEPAQPASAPPAGWTAAEKAEWSKLSPAIQAAVSRREAEISRGGQQWSEERRRIESSIAPIANLARGRGMEVGQAAQLLAAAQTMLDQNPVEGLKRIAASYGVNLANLAGQTAEGSAPSQPDLATLVRQAVAPMLGPIQQRFAAEDERQQQSMRSFVDQFAASPGHEHYAAVEPLIEALIPSIWAENPGWDKGKVLQEAYDRAVHANPTTRASLTAAAEAAAEAKRVADAKARAAKARTASSSVTGAPSGPAATGPKDSLRAEIEAAWAGSA